MAFNILAEGRSRYLTGWEKKQQEGSALERVRAGQIIEITERGTIPYEVPELTQAVLQEVWLENEGLQFVFLSGNSVTVPHEMRAWRFYIHALTVT